MAGLTCPCGKRAGRNGRCIRCNNVQEKAIKKGMVSLDGLYARNRKIVMAQRPRVCWLCGMGDPLVEDEFWSCDHILPRGRGGGNELTNLAQSHSTCNMRRGTKEVTSALIERLRHERLLDLEIFDLLPS